MSSIKIILFGFITLMRAMCIHEEQKNYEVQCYKSFSILFLRPPY